MFPFGKLDGNQRFPCCFPENSCGNLTIHRGFHYVSLRKPVVAKWFTRCLPQETSGFPLSSIRGNHYLTRVSLRWKHVNRSVGCFPSKGNHMEQGSFQDGNPMEICCKLGCNLCNLCSPSFNWILNMQSEKILFVVFSKAVRFLSHSLPQLYHQLWYNRSFHTRSCYLKV